MYNCLQNYISYNVCKTTNLLCSFTFLLLMNKVQPLLSLKWYGRLLVISTILLIDHQMVYKVCSYYISVSILFLNSIPIPVTLYQCNLLGTDCSSCLATQANFNCVFCQGSQSAQPSCNFRERCTRNPFTIRPGPVINQV